MQQSLQRQTQRLLGSHPLRIRLLMSTLMCFLLFGVMISCGGSSPRVVETKPLSIPVEVAPISAAAVTAELGVVAEQELPGAFLVEIQAIFTGANEINTQTGQIQYTYTAERGDGSPQEILLLLYDMADGQVVELVRKEQAGGDTELPQEELERSVAQVLFSSLFEQIYNDESFTRKLKSPKAELTITYTNESIAIDVK